MRLQQKTGDCAFEPQHELLEIVQLLSFVVERGVRTTDSRVAGAQKKSYSVTWYGDLTLGREHISKILVLNTMKTM